MQLLNVLNFQKTTALFSAAEITRNFIEFDAAASQHISLASPVVLSGDFEIEATISKIDTAIGAAIGSGVGDFIRLGGNVQYMINSNYYATNVAFPNDGSLVNLRLSRVGTVAKIFINGVEEDSRTVVTDDLTINYLASRGTNTFLSGILADVKIWTGGDRDTGTLTNEWLLDETLEDSDIIKSRTATEGAELVTNGTFDTDTSGWVSQRSADLSVIDGALVVTNSATGFGGASSPVALEVGATYIVSADYTHIDGSGFLMVSTNIPQTVDRMLDVFVASSSQKLEQVFIATHANAYVGVALGNTAAEGAQAQFDNITIRKVTSGTYGTAVNMTDADSEQFTFDATTSDFVGEQELVNHDFTTSSGWTIGPQVTYNAVDETMNWVSTSYPTNDSALYRTHTRPPRYRVIVDGELSTGAIGIYNGADYTNQWTGVSDFVDIDNVNLSYGYFIVRAVVGTTATVNSFELRRLLPT